MNERLIVHYGPLKLKESGLLYGCRAPFVFGDVYEAQQVDELVAFARRTSSRVEVVILDPLQSSLALNGLESDKSTQAILLLDRLQQFARAIGVSQGTEPPATVVAHHLSKRKDVSGAGTITDHTTNCVLRFQVDDKQAQVVRVSVTKRGQARIRPFGFTFAPVRGSDSRVIVPCEMSETPMAETTATAGTPSSAGVPALSVENTAKAQIAKDTDVIVQRLTEAEQGLRFTDLKSLTGLSKQRLTAALAHCGTAGRARKGEGHLGKWTLIRTGAVNLLDFCDDESDEQAA